MTRSSHCRCSDGYPRSIAFQHTANPPAPNPKPTDLGAAITGINSINSTSNRTRNPKATNTLVLASPDRHAAINNRTTSRPQAATERRKSSTLENLISCDATTLHAQVVIIRAKTTSIVSHGGPIFATSTSNLRRDKESATNRHWFTSHANYLRNIFRCSACA